MIFRTRGKRKLNESWLYNFELPDVLDDFNYLGVVFRNIGEFHITQTTIATQTQKAVARVKKAALNFQLNKETELSLFDTYTETWGFQIGPGVEKVQMAYCTMLFGVYEKRAVTFCVYSELGPM